VPTRDEVPALSQHRLCHLSDLHIVLHHKDGQGTRVLRRGRPDLDAGANSSAAAFGK
jgi:hypothetical protein